MALPARFELPIRYAYALSQGHTEPELHVIVKCLTKGDVVVDVGANVGLYAFALARRGALVHAFEPLSSCRRVLEAYAHPRIRIHSQALSDRSGRMSMKIPLWRGNSESALASLVSDANGMDTDGGSLESVEVRTLDSYGFEKVDFLKIDVEGHERQVIEGARDLIRRCKPALLVEIEQRRLASGSIAEVFGFIKSLGYAGYFFDGGKALAINQFDVLKHQLQHVSEVESTGFSRGYINNFLFIACENGRWTSLVR